ncbi:hypothetical protein, partial [uncultured Mameliella sp.]|uniref:hypothetical protein n=1 Tax=uncultured Mameliella sp. TaxID=1447087 RepID=UPI002626B1EC
FNSLQQHHFPRLSYQNGRWFRSDWQFPVTGRTKAKSDPVPPVSHAFCPAGYCCLMLLSGTAQSAALLSRHGVAPPQNHVSIPSQESDSKL